MNLSGLDLNLLYVLHVVLSERSVARAATRLHLTPSAVSNALARLRRRLDDPLLVRDGRRLVATPRALALQPALAAAVAELDSALQSHERFDPMTSTRRWSIGVTDYAETVLLPNLLKRLLKIAPRTSLRLVPVQTALQSRALQSGEVSLLLGIFHNVPDSCRSAELWRDEMVCIVRRDHPQVRGRLSLQRYATLPHVLVALFGDTTGPVDHLLAERGLARNTALVVSHFISAPLAVASSDCVSTIPARLAYRFAPVLGLKVHAPPLPVPGFAMQAMWHERSHNDSSELFLRTLIAESAKEAI